MMPALMMPNTTHSLHRSRSTQDTKKIALMQEAASRRTCAAVVDRAPAGAVTAMLADILRPALVMASVCAPSLLHDEAP